MQTFLGTAAQFNTLTIDGQAANSQTFECWTHRYQPGSIPLHAISRLSDTDNQYIDHIGDVEYITIENCPGTGKTLHVEGDMSSWADIDDGDYAVGANFDETGRLRAVTIYLDDSIKPAFPHASITITTVEDDQDKEWPWERKTITRHTTRSPSAPKPKKT